MTKHYEPDEFSQQFQEELEERLAKLSTEHLISERRRESKENEAARESVRLSEERLSDSDVYLSAVDKELKRRGVEPGGH